MSQLSLSPIMNLSGTNERCPTAGRRITQTGPIKCLALQSVSTLRHIRTLLVDAPFYNSGKQLIGVRALLDPMATDLNLA